MASLKESQLVSVLDTLTAPSETLALRKKPYVTQEITTSSIERLTLSPKRHDQLISLGYGIPKARPLPVDRLRRQVISQRNVVGVGIVDKVRGRKKSLAIAVYVKKKLPLSKLSPGRVIPPTIPEAIAGVKPVLTDVIEIGKFEAIGGLKPNRKAVFVTRKPIQPGNSVGHFRSTAGTLGAIVRAKNSTSKQRMILSNSHVLALSGKAKKGDPVLYPGKADKGKVPGDVVARLENDVKFRVGGKFINEVDCAVASIERDNTRPVNPRIRGCKAPKGTIQPKRGMKIRMAGRTSGISNGVVKDVHFRFAVPYPGLGSVGFRDQVLCTRYSEPGDSGSLVFDRKTGRAVGLHFAATSQGSVFCPIEKVLQGLSVELELA
jgi:hypothetical protein